MSDQKEVETVLDKLGLSSMKNTVLNSNVTVFEGEMLTSLDLSDLGIKELPDGIFDNLSKMKRLYLNYNNISSISATFFANLQNLTFLSLFANNMQTLPDEVFEHLPNLEWLDLRENNLEALPKSILSLKKLKYLFLQNNDTLTNGKYDFNQDYHSKRDVDKFVASFQEKLGIAPEEKPKKVAKKKAAKKPAAKAEKETKEKAQEKPAKDEAKSDSE